MLQLQYIATYFWTYVLKLWQYTKTRHGKDIFQDMEISQDMEVLQYTEGLV